MNKQQFEVTFPNFSRSTFRRIDDHFELTGLYVRVVPLEEDGLPDERDVWICNARRGCRADSMTKGLGTGKRNNLVALATAGVEVVTLDGEAYFQTTDLALVRGWLEKNRVRLGIKKRVVGGKGNPEALLRHRNAVSTNLGTAVEGF